MNQQHTTWRWAVKAEATDADAKAPEAPKSKYAGNTPEARRERARHAALVRYGKENPMQARLAAIREARKAKKKGKGGGGKPKVDKAAEQAKQEAANIEKVGEALLDADAPLSKNGLAALLAFAAGGALSPEMAKSLAANGIVTLGADGTPRMSADSRAIVNAAKKGDVRAAVDAAFAAGEKVGVGAAGEKLPGKEDAPKDAPKEAAEKPKKGGGGGGGKGGKEKPTADEKDAEKAKARAEATAKNRAAVIDGMAQQDAGLSPQAARNLSAFSDGGSLDDKGAQALAEMGMVEIGSDGSPRLTPAGRRAATAMDRGDVRGAIDAISEGVDRVKGKADTDAARAKRERERADASTARDKARADKERQELDDLADDFRSKTRGLSMKEQRRLVRAGRATFGPDGKFTLSATKSWRWAVKAEDDANTPPAAVQAAARRALERRAKAPPSQRGMTPVGLARARDLSNGRPVSVATARRMVNYFTRHQKDKQGATWGDYGPGRQAWDGWGGDAGWRWARGVVARADGDGATKALAWRWDFDSAIKHGKHDQSSHGRKGRAGRAGASAYAAARAGGASHQEALAKGREATAAERATERAEMAQRRTDRLTTQAQRARAAANGGQVTEAQRARLNAKADRLEARARGEKVGPAVKPSAQAATSSTPAFAGRPEAQASFGKPGTYGGRKRIQVNDPSLPGIDGYGVLELNETRKGNNRYSVDVPLGYVNGRQDYGRLVNDLTINEARAVSQIAVRYRNPITGIVDVQLAQQDPAFAPLLQKVRARREKEDTTATKAWRWDVKGVQ